MAGTHRPKLGKYAPPGPLRRGPVIVLVEPQLGENIGAAARAMLNCGITELRLVNPRDGWPNPSAYVLASKADAVLDAVSVFKSTAEAVADLHRVYATTARHRDLMKEFVTPREAAIRIRAEEAEGDRVGILFGRERTGLDNEDVALAHTAINVPLNPGFSSLNLAQAVLLIGYEWFTAADQTPASRMETVRGGFATQEEIQGLFGHLTAELDRSGFFHNVEPKRPAILRNLRNVLQRVPLASQEVRTFRGMLKAIAQGRPLRQPYSQRKSSSGQQAKAENGDDKTGGADSAG
ncbi:MAG TPA: RNA methyltransferase [Ferrovibrio sp.]|jgi:tRNA/rRNA methyltransferase|uniref:RNA methyltransferase n=1 Tax=Ferrovibrio sp. TaxID=1917215 RepID=UPI002ED2CA70